MDLHESGIQHREDLHVTVVVDRLFAVGFQMEGVDHVHIVQVSGGCLVGKVHRMLQRQIPHRESLELGITGGDAPLVVMVQLAQAGGHLAAAGTGGGDDDQRTGGLNVVIDAETLIGHDVSHIVGIAGDVIVPVAPDAQLFQTLQEGVCRRLAAVTGQHHAAHIQAHLPEGVNQAQNVCVIGNAQVAPDLVLFNIRSVDGDDHFCVIGKLLQHPDLAVRLKAGKHPGCVVIVKKLAAKFQIQLAAELGDPLADLFRLGGKIFLIVKAHSAHVRNHSYTKIKVSIPQFSPSEKHQPFPRM